jgi:hypothetical protein
MQVAHRRGADFNAVLVWTGLPKPRAAERYF